MEQKNWTLVRRLVGYDRYSSEATYEVMEDLYRVLRLYANLFQPLRKFIGKERVGAKIRKRYDQARTPYERLLGSGVLHEEKRAQLDRLYMRLNPVQARAEIDQALEELWKLAEGPKANSLPSRAAGRQEGFLLPTRLGRQHVPVH